MLHSNNDNVFPLHRGCVGRPLDYFEPARLARTLHEPVDLYGGFVPSEHYDEPRLSEAREIVFGIVVSLLLVGAASVMLLLSGCSW